MLSPLSPYVSLPAAALALVASLAAVPVLALLAAGIAARVARAAPGAAGRVSGQIPLGLGAAAGFGAMALLAETEVLSTFAAVPLGLLSLVLVVVGGALAASPASRAAIRVARAPAAVPPAARVVFGLALAVCGWSLASRLRLVQAALTHEAFGAGLVPVLTFEALPSLVIWGVGRAAMVTGAVALLRARYAGMLAYTAGFALVGVPVRVTRSEVR